MTSNSIQAFDFHGEDVRAFEDDKGNRYFSGKDVATALGYKDTTNALKQHCRGVVEYHPIVDALGRTQELRFITEGDLYRLIASSKLPSAQEFESWIFDTVVPSIRRHGGYMAGQETMTPEQMALASMRWLHSKVEEQQAQLEAQKPKVLFADAVSASQTSILVGQLAKIIQQNGVDIGQKRLFAWLRDHHYLSSRYGEDYNMPLQRYVEQGLFQIKESTHTNPDGVTFTTRTVKVTGKGQQYFVNKFLTKTLEAEA